MNLQAKQEDDANQLLPKARISSSKQWSAFRNPRIVRVQPTFGGKDRHSKVCAIRGLRDRRIRLSVPTAIQLYDIQDKLGLGQPSKVIDWLLDVTKNDIDDLPPLQIPLGFDQLIHHQQQPQYGSFNHPQYQFDSNFNSSERFKLADSRDIVMGESSSRGKEKEVYNYNQGGNFNSSSYNFLNNGLPFYNWDPSSLSLASTPRLPSSSFGSHQFFFSPPPPQAPSTNMASALFPMYANSHQYESRTISNNFQLLSSGNISSSHHQFLVGSSTNINKPFSLNENPGLDDHPQKMMIDREKDIG